MRGPLALAAAAFLLLGCQEEKLPPPQVISIEPSEMVSSGTANVTITVDVVLPYVVDYGTSEISVTPSLILSVGTYQLPSSKYVNGGMVPGFLPSKLLPGVYDVTASISADRVGTLPGAFRVTPGSWPRGYTIDPIPNQTVDVPFQITIRTNPALDTFVGTVDYAVSRGALQTTRTTQPFAAGARQESVTIPSGPGTYQLTVTDLMGTQASTTVNVTQ